MTVIIWTGNQMLVARSGPAGGGGLLQLPSVHKFAAFVQESASRRRAQVCESGQKGTYPPFRCQIQPFTKMQERYFASTMSGETGSGHEPHIAQSHFLPQNPRIGPVMYSVAGNC